VGGRGAERVLRAPTDGVVSWEHEIGDLVAEGEIVGRVGDEELPARFSGVIRGLIAANSHVGLGQKIGDIDPRAHPSACHEISDKSLAVGGGVVEAIMTWPEQSS
jgi:xanthine dehydrogenase accessory factor